MSWFKRGKEAVVPVETEAVSEETQILTRIMKKAWSHPLALKDKNGTGRLRGTDGLWYYIRSDQYYSLLVVLSDNDPGPNPSSNLPRPYGVYPYVYWGSSRSNKIEETGDMKDNECFRAIMFADLRGFLRELDEAVAENTRKANEAQAQRETKLAEWISAHCDTPETH